MDAACQGRLEETFKREEPILIRWLTATLGDMESALDVSQSAFEKVWAYAAECEVKNPKALIYKAAGRLAIDELRRRRRSMRNTFVPERTEGFDPFENMPSQAPTPEESAVLKQQAARVLEALEELPDNSKAAFTMYRFGELNYGQIAEEMQISKSSVEKYMIVALRRMREAAEMPAPVTNRNRPLSVVSN